MGVRPWDISPWGCGAGGIREGSAPGDQAESVVWRVFPSETWQYRDSFPVESLDNFTACPWVGQGQAQCQDVPLFQLWQRVPLLISSAFFCIPRPLEQHQACLCVSVLLRSFSFRFPCSLCRPQHCWQHGTA